MVGSAVDTTVESREAISITNISPPKTMLSWRPWRATGSFPPMLASMRGGYLCPFVSVWKIPCYDVPVSLMELRTHAIAAGGGCVARADDGRVVFVRHSLPDETVMARVTGETTSFLRADAVEILEPSPDRVVPPCPHAGPGRCGGCDFQHVAVPAQRVLKAALVSEQLRRLAGDRPTGGGRGGARRR